jgi:hypothetical protein
VFTVAGTRARLADQLEDYAGASEARLVQEHIRQMITQREENIRDVFRHVLEEGTRRPPGPGVG